MDKLVVIECHSCPRTVCSISSSTFLAAAAMIRVTECPGGGVPHKPHWRPVNR